MIAVMRLVLCFVLICAVVTSIGAAQTQSPSAIPNSPAAAAPGPVEEFIFYDHPSGRTRITAAMRWKAENLDTASPEEVNRPMFDSK